MNAIGIIGAGEIGWRMGKLLLAAGHTVIGYDICPDALHRAKQSGFLIADSIPDLCKNADLILSCVTDGKALRDVVTGPSGLAAHFAAGKPYIDTTSAEPWITIDEIAPLLAEMRIPFLDAPVSGGVPAAEVGRMNFMVGGDAELLAKCREIMRILGPVITHVGPVGSGHTIKAINMLALAASMLSTAELAAVGIYRGHALSKVIETLQRSEGSSYSTRIHFPRFIIPGNYASGFSFDLMFKDLSIGIALAKRCGIPLFLEKTTFDLYQAAADAGLKGQDNTRVVERIISVRSETRTSGVAKDLSHIPLLARACNMVIAAETICFGVATGLSAEAVINVISESSGDTYALSHDIASYLRNGGRAPSLKTLAEAAKAVVADAPKGQIKFPLITQTAELCNEAIARFGDNADSRTLLDLIAHKTKQGDALRMMWETAIGNW